MNDLHIFLESKFEVEPTVYSFIPYVERETWRMALNLRSDNVGEYGSQHLDKNLTQRGILFEKTEPYMPEQNGMAERTNSVLMD